MFYKWIQIPYRKVYCQRCSLCQMLPMHNLYSVPLTKLGEGSFSNKLAARVLWTHGLWAIFSSDIGLCFASPYWERESCNILMNFWKVRHFHSCCFCLKFYMQLSSFCPFHWKKIPCLKRNVSYQCVSTIQLRNTLGGCSL